MKTDFITLTINEDSKCIKCWREFVVGESMTILVKDDTIWLNSKYCPRSIDHIDSLSEYKNYLRDEKGISDPKILLKKGHEWEIYRVRKGYMNIVNIEKITPLHKSAFKDMINYEKRKAERNLGKLSKNYQRQKEKILKEVVDLEEALEDWND